MSIPAFVPSQGFENNEQGSLFTLLGGPCSFHSLLFFQHVYSGSDVTVEKPNMCFGRLRTLIVKSENGVFLSLQDHFEQSQFEEIARSSAGGKKLKPNAIPTLFSFGEPPYPAVTSPYILLPMKSEAGMELNSLSSRSGKRSRTRAAAVDSFSNPVFYRLFWQLIE